MIRTDDYRVETDPTGRFHVVFDATGGFVRVMPAIMGGDGTDEGEGEGGAGDGGADDDGNDESQDDVDDDEDQDENERISLKQARRLRRESADRRKENEALKADLDAIKQANEETKKAFAKALGIDVDDDDDPDKLKNALQEERTEREKRDSELTALKLERAVHKAARKVGGDEELVYAYLTTRADFKELDAASADLDDQVSKMVQAAMKEKENLKQGRVPGKSGSDLSGGGPTDDKRPGMGKAIEAELAKRRAS